jgi:hypothetical protein
MHLLTPAARAPPEPPAFSVPNGTPALFEEAGGILRPEAMVAAHCGVAAWHGATLRTRERVGRAPGSILGWFGAALEWRGRTI